MTSALVPNDHHKEAQKPLLSFLKRRWPWPQSFLCLTLLLLGSFVFWRGIIDLAWLAWHDGESSHILLVPPLLVYLIIQRKVALLQAGPSAGWLGVVLLAAAVFSWEYGYRNDLRVAGHLAIVFLLIGASVAAFGHRAAWAGLSILGLMLFFLPIPYGVRIQFALPAQRITAMVAEQVLLIGNVNVLRTGSVLHLGDTPVGVAEACNGMRMLFAVVLICYAYAVATPMRWWARVALMLVSPAVALACNVVRVVLTAWVYGWADTDTAAVFHDLSGWAIAGLAFGIIWSLAGLTEWLGVDVFKSEGVQHRAEISEPQIFLPWAGVVGGGILLVGLGFNQTHLSPLDAEDYHEEVREAVAQIPRALGPYVGTDVELPPAASELLSPNVLFARRFQHSIDSADVFTLMYVHCYDARDMLGHHPPVCYPSQGWELIEREVLANTSVGPVSVFRFGLGLGIERRFLTVAQGFHVPGGPPTVEMKDVNRVAGNFRVRHLGAAQWQLVMPGRKDDVGVMEIVDKNKDKINLVGVSVKGGI